MLVLQLILPSQHFFNENAMISNDFGRNSLFFNEALMKGNGLPISLTDHWHIIIGWNGSLMNVNEIQWPLAFYKHFIDES
jgi:hypothetical protein